MVLSLSHKIIFKINFYRELVSQLVVFLIEPKSELDPFKLGKLKHKFQLDEFWPELKQKLGFEEFLMFYNISIIKIIFFYINPQYS